MYSEGREPERRSHLFSQAMEQELVQLVKNAGDAPDWRALARYFGVRVSAVQNKYTALTEPEWTQSAEKKLLELFEQQSSTGTVNVQDITQKLNESMQSAHTERGVMLKLERITRYSRFQYKMPRVTNKLNKPLRCLINALEGCIQEEMPEDSIAFCKQYLEDAEKIVAGDAKLQQLLKPSESKPIIPSGPMGVTNE